MSDNLDDIRRWHALYRDPTSQHWQHVDELLAALGNLAGVSGDDLAALVADMECARDGLDDAINALRPAKRKRVA